MLVRKSKKDKRKVYRNRFKYIPKHLLAEIIARVASASFTDLCNVKLCCKEFREAALENCVFEHVTLKQFPVFHSWVTSNDVLSFLDRCLKNGNPEALFRQGMTEFFSTLKPVSGLQCLKRASKKGHIEATYVYGIILICYGGQLREDGLKALSCLKTSKPMRLVIRECRKNVKAIVSRMWVTNFIIGDGPNESKKFNTKTCNCDGAILDISTASKRSEWSNNEDCITACNSCLWDKEAAMFFNMVWNYNPDRNVTHSVLI